MSNPQLKTSSLPQIVLQFAQASDRWHHRFVIIQNDEATEFMASVEGTPEEDWPASPPLQDATRHSLPDGDAILCVGMAGKSHWSAAYTIEPAIGGQLVRADLACLQKEIPTSAKLGSRYQVNPDWTVSNTFGAIELAWQSLKIVIEPENDAKFGATENQVDIAPKEFSDSPKVATRWGFQVSVRS